MVWLALATSTAFFEAMKDVLSKNRLGYVDEYVLTFSISMFTALVLTPLLFFNGIPVLKPPFWLALVIGGLLNSISFLLYVRAIKLSDLSITLPIINFTPLFLLITSPLIVQEFLTISDFLGSLLIILGSYVLNWRAKRRGWLAPFRAIIQEPGPKLMLIVAFIWSITANIDKVGVQNSSPLVWAIAIFLTIGLFLLPMVIYKSPRFGEKIALQWRGLLLIGVSNALGILFQMTALTLTLVVNVIAVKRTSTLIGALFGFLVFKEQNIQQRLLGAAIMVLGVLFVSQG